MMDVPAVELRNVSKVFSGGVKAVDELSLQIGAGRVVALLGPSGCGKTTSLRLINRLEEPTAGEVLVRGRDVRQERPEHLRRSIGYVIQEGGLFPHRDVSANVAVVPRLLGWPRTRTRRRVGDVLEMVGLPEREFGRRKPAELSGGQRQRVGVARALAADPDLLLMDEPFGALDPGTRESIHDEFLRLQAHLRKTVVLVTHDIAEAGKLADDIVVLDRGRIAQCGSLAELLLHPADERIRVFLGKRGQELTLSVLRLGQILSDVPSEPAAAGGVRLSPAMTLAEVLVVLAEAGEHATVAVDGTGTYSARRLQQAIVADLRVTRFPAQEAPS
jgi:osmoprotectant transport system ATP-binding protein